MKEYLVLRLALCAGGLSETAFAGPCYDVEVLWGQSCGIFGPAGVFPADIAVDGTIVGAVEQCEEPALKEGFVWPVVDDPFVIPRPTGATNLYATCINDRGQVGVQITFTDNEFGFLAHIYDIATDIFTLVGVPPGGNYSVPYGINNDSQACGEWGNSATGPSIQAFVSTGRGLIDLSPLLTGPNSIARDINDRGSVVGSMGGTVGPMLRGFLWRGDKVIDFGVAPGCINSSARAVNQHDEVAASGAATTPGGNFARPFLWIDGNWTIIDMLPGFEICGTSDLNDATVIVGTCVTPGNAGYVWIEGVTYDLNKRISIDSGVEIRSARAINNAGQIACEGTTQHPFFGFSRVGVRLTPRSPQPADFTDDCTVDGEDLMILLQSWGPMGKRNANPDADLDRSGVVNGFDLAMLLAAWG